MRRKSVAAVATAAACLAGTLSFAVPSGASRTTWATATSVAAGGGMKALVKAAEKEGALNVIALPPTWANYGTMLKDFSKKYHIKVTSANPTGSSAQEVQALQQLKGQTRAPDVIDVSTPFAVTATEHGLLAPYRVAEWKTIPVSAKTAKGNWYDDYGGYIAIGYTSAKVKNPPTTFADLLKPTYHGEVGIDGTPTQTGSAFAAVLAAALANGGSFSNVMPGVSFFNKLYQEGNFIPVEAGPSTAENGTTPIILWWDYLMAATITAKLPTWREVIPAKGLYAGYYTQAIAKSAPHPAAARLWEEYLYSKAGQNTYLQGKARPIELPIMEKDHTATPAAVKVLPPVPSSTISLPTTEELTKDGKVLAQSWSTKVTSG